MESLRPSQSMKFCCWIENTCFQHLWSLTSLFNSSAWPRNCTVIDHSPSSFPHPCLRETLRSWLCEHGQEVQESKKCLSLKPGWDPWSWHSHINRCMDKFLVTGPGNRMAAIAGQWRSAQGPQSYFMSLTLLGTQHCMGTGISVICETMAIIFIHR